MTIPRIIWPTNMPPELRVALDRFNSDVINYTKIPEYANNAAALSAGLAQGELYHTAAGVVMVVI